MGNVKGLKETLTKLNKLGKDLDPQIDRLVEAAAQAIEGDAKNYAQKLAKDTGKLSQSIEAYRSGELTWTVGANTTGLAPYAPYIEFGTGPQVSVPAELQEQAAKFQGRKTGSFQDALDNIASWAKGKGIKDPEKAAYPILMSILKKGLRPRPFMYPAFVNNRDMLPELLEDLLEKESKKI